MNATSSPQQALFPLTGYDFARSVLDQEPERGVEILLEAAGANEADWLEKKAAVYRSERKDESFRRALENCPSEQMEQKKNRLNLFLLAEIAQAIVAIHNSRGGVLFIGIDDKTNDPVSFEDNDGGEIWKANGKGDYVLKAVLARLVRENGEFRFDHETLIVPVENVGVVPKWCRYKGADVLALLIPPLAPEKNPLEVTHVENNAPWKSVPKRTPGDVGQVKKGMRNDAWIGSVAQLADFHYARRERFLNQTDLAYKLKKLGLSVPDSSFSENPRQKIALTVDAPRAPLFVGRDKELDELDRLLSHGKIPVVTGPGGTGKSELVLQYAGRHKADYPGGLFQIDMEQAKNWDDAFRKLLGATRVAMRDVLDLPANGAEAGKKGQSSASAQDVASALCRRAERFGRILLVLDNVESVRTFLRGPAFDNLSLSSDVRLVATARTCDVDFRPTDRACPFALRDLTPEAALELLLADNPAESDAERSAAASIAKMLDYRALFLKAVPALLDDPYSPCAGAWTMLESALRDNLQETVDAATKDYGEEERTPSALWALTRQSLARYPMGAAWIKLAHVASFFSADGFRKSILRHLWGALVAPGAGTDREFDQALDVLRRHGVLDDNTDGTQFRMHRLTFATLRRAAREDDPEIEDKIGSTVANALETSADGWTWLSLADSERILNHIPDDQLDGTLCRCILLRNPAFAAECPWEKLREHDWLILLRTRPQFSDRCPWDDLNAPRWTGWKNPGMPGWPELISAQPQFAERCIWDNLDGDEWGILLGNCPQYADRCRWDKLDVKNWCDLLPKQPRFVDRCPLERLNGSHWVYLLVRRPQLAEKCPWKKLDGHHWVYLLESRPRFAEKCPWDKLDGSDWVELLGGRIDDWSLRSTARLQFADRCDWSKLDGSDWASLLVRQPQFDDRCDWEKLTGSDWVFLLLGGWNAHEIDPADAAWAGVPRPDLLKRCPWKQLSDDDLDLVFDDPSFPDWMEPKPDYFKLVSNLAKEKDPNAMFAVKRIKKLGYGEKTEA